MSSGLLRHEPDAIVDEASKSTVVPCLKLPAFAISAPLPTAFRCVGGLTSVNVVVNLTLDIQYYLC